MTTRGRWMAGAAALLVSGVLAGLGTWQMQRLAWKHHLIETIRARTAAPAIPAPPLGATLSSDDEAIDYTLMRVEGRWRGDLEVTVDALVGAPRGRFGGPGVWVVTPVERADGSYVWVNRGFVPTGRRAEAAPAAGPAAIEGLARRPETRGFFMPPDQPAKRMFFVRDARALSAAVGLPVEKTLPYSIDAGVGATPPSGLPQAGETRLAFSDNHLGYALTWYGLSIASLVVFWFRMRAERRRDEGFAAAA